MRMGVSSPDRTRSSAGRFANRCGKWARVLGTILILLMIAGCRSIETTASDQNSRETDDMATPKRSLLSRATRSLRPDKKQAVAKRQLPYDVPVASPELSDDDATIAEDDDDQIVSSRSSVIRKTHSTDDNKGNPSIPFKVREDLDQTIEVVGFREEQSSTDKNVLQDGSVPKQLRQDSGKSPKSLSLEIPLEIPGATAPRHRLLPRTDDDDVVAKAKKIKVIDLLFPQRAEPFKIATPTDRFMTLEELELIALENHPAIAQARAQITVSQGSAIQASVYPNPSLGYESDTVGSSFTKNYQGINIQQPIKTAGKLALARNAANMDVMNAELALKRTQFEVLRSVRAGYYNVLVAQEAMRFNEAFERLTRQVYEAMKERLKGGEQSLYELDQYNSSVSQAKVTLVQSQNRYKSAWMQLAVTTGVSDLQPATLEGQVDMPVPNLDRSLLLERMLTIHPNLYAARNLEKQAQIQLNLARVVPIPDITVGGAFQNDFTTPGYGRTSYNLNVSVPIPFYDRNQGNIKSALGKLNMMAQQNKASTLELTVQLADAFERFQSGRFQSENYRTQILPDLVRAYQGVYDAHLHDNPEVALSDIIFAQQNLSNGVAIYVSGLLAQWLALTDIANLTQLDDFKELWNFAAPRSVDSGAVVPSPQPQEGTRP